MEKKRLNMPSTQDFERMLCELRTAEKVFGSNRTIGNIIQNIESIIKWRKDHAKDSVL